MDVSYSFNARQEPFKPGESWCCEPNFHVKLPTKTVTTELSPVPGFVSWEFGVSATVTYNTTNYFEAWPFIQVFPNGKVTVDRWDVHGQTNVFGKLSLFANDHLLGQSQIAFTLPGTCLGYHPDSCTRSGSMLPVDGYGSLGPVNGEDVVSLKIVLDEFFVEGRYNDDVGTVYWADFSGNFTLNDLISIEPSTTPVPVAPVPLPGAIWLLATALVWLIMMTKRRR